MNGSLGWDDHYHLFLCKCLAADAVATLSCMISIITATTAATIAAAEEEDFDFQKLRLEEFLIF